MSENKPNIPSTWIDYVVAVLYRLMRSFLPGHHGAGAQRYPTA